MLADRPHDAGADYGRYYWTTGRYLVSTDDAYVDAHSVIISPKIAGYVSAVPVESRTQVEHKTVSSAAIAWTESSPTALM